MISLPEANCFHELGHRNQPGCSGTAAHHVSVHMPLNSGGGGSNLHHSLICSPQLQTQSWLGWPAWSRSIHKQWHIIRETTLHNQTQGSPLKISQIWKSFVLKALSLLWILLKTLRSRNSLSKSCLFTLDSNTSSYIFSQTPYVSLLKYSRFIRAEICYQS